MKIVQINATCGVGSTGKICVSISELLSNRETENYILYCSGNSDYPLGIKCADNKYIRSQALKARMLGNWGFNSEKSTRKMIAELERLNPDIVHLHNIHGHDCNLDMLFGYFKTKHTKLIWTFHDCWAFTGYCTYFDMAGCDKWKTECRNCPQKKSYSWFLDSSDSLFKKKKELFSDLDLTIVTPSKWLADLVGQSFLSDYPVCVINNGIDTGVFKPTESDFRGKYSLCDKYIVLGVAFGWDARKGLDIFIELSERLPDNYQIVLVGTDDNTDKRLSDKFISIHRTKNQQELASIYSAADVFVNPTREENYPTVNMEAIACGTPVVTFDTGGSAEIINDRVGVSVKKDDIELLTSEIIRIVNEQKDIVYFREYAEKLDSAERFKEYLSLYGKVAK